MTVKRMAWALSLLALICSCIMGQTTSGNLLGTVTDPGDAAVPAVQIEIRNLTTGAVRTTTSGPEGLFRFNSLEPGRYALTIKASGFKAYEQTDIAVTANEIRDLGRVQLVLGSLAEEVSVTATATPVQTASSEKSTLVDSTQIQNITLKGRDLFGILVTIPGAVAGQGDSTNVTSISGVQINGSGTTKTSFEVDGVASMDTGSNASIDFEPNMDAIAEIRVLTANYQAQYGRNSGGTISLVTKGGGQEFHGSAWVNKRHEMFNAKNFFQNYNNQQKSFYRFFVWGYSVGGPVYVPKVFNTKKQRLFFFVSQEHTKQKPATDTGYANMPTAAQRAGDFTGYSDGNGKLYSLRDPTTGGALPNNNVAAIAPLFDAASEKYGLAMLNFLPMPNLCGRPGVSSSGCINDADPSQLYKRNYYYSFNQSHPRRNDVVRIDWNTTSKLTSWVRYANDYDLSNIQGTFAMKNAQGQWVPWSLDRPQPGHGWGVGTTYTISPTTVNEATFGKSYTSWSNYAHDPSQLDRSMMANPPHWFDEKDPNFTNDHDLPRPLLSPGSQNYQVGVPGINFGGGQEPSEQNYKSSCGSGQCPYTNWEDRWSFNDVVSKVWGAHNFKAGIYFEKNEKVVYGLYGGTGDYLGNYSFASAAAMPSDTQDGYANAFLGNFNSYNEGQRVMGDFWNTDIQGFVQDNWRIGRRLTIDLGVRFYHLAPIENTNGGAAEWVRSTYNPAQAARIYYPYCTVSTAKAACPTANQKAYDPVTGYMTYYALQGTFVPYSVGGYSSQPNLFPGMQVANGSNPYLPMSLFTPPTLSPAFRFGLAWDVFGNGKTAVRMGVGQFLNQGDGNQIYSFSPQPPVAVNKTIYYSTINSVPNYVNSGAISPMSLSEIIGDQRYEGAYNGSFMIQQNVGFGTVVETAYVLNLRRHILQTRNLNGLPMYAQYDPSHDSPMVGYLPPNTSGKGLSDNYFRPLAGLGTMTWRNFEGSANYHSLQISVRRNMTNRLSYGLAYTWSKSMSASPSDYWPDKYRNYGPSYQPAPQVLVVNYVYQLPSLGKRLNIRPLGWVTDNWSISGITQLRSNIRTGVPGISFSGSSSTNPTMNWTGSAEGARLLVVKNPTLPDSQVSFVGGGSSNIGPNGTPGNQIIDSSALVIPYPCSWTPAADPHYGVGQSMSCFGNAGPGSIITLPNTRMDNWDMTFAKSFPLKSERRVLMFRAEMYNIFNHTQFTNANISPSYDWSNWQKGVLVQTNANMGRYTSATNPRQMSMSLRFQF